MVESAQTVIEHRVMSARQAIFMRRSLNGKSPREIRAGLRTGEYRMFSTSVNGFDSYAIVSMAGDCLRIEALQGKHGLRLARHIIDVAHAHGLRVDAWPLSASIVRLVRRLGMLPTGEMHGTQARVIA